MVAIYKIILIFIDLSFNMRYNILKPYEEAPRT
jgi:hypothetical protein